MNFVILFTAPLSRLSLRVRCEPTAFHLGSPAGSSDRLLTAVWYALGTTLSLSPDTLIPSLAVDCLCVCMQAFIAMATQEVKYLGDCTVAPPGGEKAPIQQPKAKGTTRYWLSLQIWICHEKFISWDDWFIQMHCVFCYSSVSL